MPFFHRFKVQGCKVQKFPGLIGFQVSQFQGSDWFNLITQVFAKFVIISSLFCSVLIAQDSVLFFSSRLKEPLLNAALINRSAPLTRSPHSSTLSPFLFTGPLARLKEPQPRKTQPYLIPAAFHLSSASEPLSALLTVRRTAPILRDRHTHNATTMVKISQITRYG